MGYFSNQVATVSVSKYVFFSFKKNEGKSTVLYVKSGSDVGMKEV